MLLALLLAFGLAFAHDNNPTSPPLPSALLTTEYPIPNEGNLLIHDPNILFYNNTFYAFKGAPSLARYKAPAMSGPWESLGTILDGPSIIDKVNQSRPWAPTIIDYNGKFYCFYCISQIGTRNSSIGLATSDSLEQQFWNDHGAIVNTGTGYLSNVFPYTVSDAIDPSVIIDPADGKPWLTFGSYWTDIWQVPLAGDLLSVENATAPTAHHLSMIYLSGNRNKILDWYPLWKDSQGDRPEEGSWISYKKPYYYLWYSHGHCCSYDPHHLPPPGDEYSIRVGRSLNVSGPYTDKNGQSLLDGGGYIVYGSNHGVVYAPGGTGVVTRDSEPDIFYFHYLNLSVSLAFGEARLGWTYLEYKNGWPVPVTSVINGVNSGNTSIETGGSRDVESSTTHSNSAPVLSPPRILIYLELLIISFLPSFRKSFL